MHERHIAKRAITALVIALTLLGAGRLPDMDHLLERVPTAVRAATN